MGECTVSDKPSYLKVLNAIANGERRAGIYLKAWADKTPDPAVKQVLATVALRESEHAWAFEKRMCELGFDLQDRPDPNFEKNLEIVTSNRSDVEKFEALGYKLRRDDEERPNPFKGIFDDTSIDIQTGALLGRYVAEEHDSGRLLQGCYEAVKAQQNGGPAASAGHGDVTLADVCNAVERLGSQLASLQGEVAELRSR